MKKFAFIVLVFIITSFGNSFAWSLFGPKNVQDCILDGMKGVNNDFAAGQVYRACKEKFPEKKSIVPKTRSGTPRVNIWDGNAGAVLVANIEVGSWNGAKLSVTNRNKFKLTGVYIGVVDDKNKDKNQCKPIEKHYKEIYFCSGSVGANLTGSVDCSAAKIKNYCVTGILASFEEDLDIWFKNNGF